MGALSYSSPIQGLTYENVEKFIKDFKATASQDDLADLLEYIKAEFGITRLLVCNIKLNNEDKDKARLLEVLDSRVLNELIMLKYIPGFIWESILKSKQTDWMTNILMSKYVLSEDDKIRIFKSGLAENILTYIKHSKNKPTRDYLKYLIEMPKEEILKFLEVENCNKITTTRLLYNNDTGTPYYYIAFLRELEEYALCSGAVIKGVYNSEVNHFQKLYNSLDPEFLAINQKLIPLITPVDDAYLKKNSSPVAVIANFILRANINDHNLRQIIEANPPFYSEVIHLAGTKAARLKQFLPEGALFDKNLIGARTSFAKEIKIACETFDLVSLTKIFELYREADKISDFEDAIDIYNGKKPDALLVRFFKDMIIHKKELEQTDAYKKYVDNIHSQSDFHLKFCNKPTQIEILESHSTKDITDFLNSGMKIRSNKSLKLLDSRVLDMGIAIDIKSCITIYGLKKTRDFLNSLDSKYEHLKELTLESIESIEPQTKSLIEELKIPVKNKGQFIIMIQENPKIIENVLLIKNLAQGLDQKFDMSSLFDFANMAATIPNVIATQARAIMNAPRHMKKIGFGHYLHYASDKESYTEYIDATNMMSYCIKKVQEAEIYIEENITDMKAEYPRLFKAIEEEKVKNAKVDLQDESSHYEAETSEESAYYAYYKISLLKNKILEWMNTNTEGNWKEPKDLSKHYHELTEGWNVYIANLMKGDKQNLPQVRARGIVKRSPPNFSYKNKKLEIVFPVTISQGTKVGTNLGWCTASPGMYHYNNIRNGEALLFWVKETEGDILAQCYLTKRGNRFIVADYKTPDNGYDAPEIISEENILEYFNNNFISNNKFIY